MERDEHSELRWAAAALQVGNGQPAKNLTHASNAVALLDGALVGRWRDWASIAVAQHPAIDDASVVALLDRLQPTANTNPQDLLFNPNLTGDTRRLIISVSDSENFTYPHAATLDSGSLTTLHRWLSTLDPEATASELLPVKVAHLPNAPDSLRASYGRRGIPAVSELGESTRFDTYNTGGYSFWPGVPDSTWRQMLDQAAAEVARWAERKPHLPDWVWEACLARSAEVSWEHLTCQRRYDLAASWALSNGNSLLARRLCNVPTLTSDAHNDLRALAAGGLGAPATAHDQRPPKEHSVRQLLQLLPAAPAWFHIEQNAGEQWQALAVRWHGSATELEQLVART